MMDVQEYFSADVRELESAVAPEFTARMSGRQGADEGPNIVEMALVVCERGRFLASLCSVPPQLYYNPRPVFTHFLDAGCHLLVPFAFWDANASEAASHVVVAEGYDERGMIVLDGNYGWLDGTTIELMPPAMTEDKWQELEKWCEANSHGSRRVLPFFPVLDAPTRPFGLAGTFLVVHPAEALEAMQKSAAAEVEESRARVKAGGLSVSLGGGERSVRSFARPLPR